MAKKRNPYLCKKEAQAWSKLLKHEGKAWAKAGTHVLSEFAGQKPPKRRRRR